jgi:AAA family ATPase
LGTSRASGDTDSGAGSHEGVLTSLLNEMDGVQELLGVTVVAATNRPNVIVQSYLFWRCQDHFLN